MEEKKGTISLSTILLIIAIIAMIVMGVYIYKLNNEKAEEVQKSNRLQEQVTNLNENVSDLQGEKDTLSSEDTTNNVDISTTASINKRLYRLYNNQRYILLIDDNSYDMDQDFLKKKTYILDLNMTNDNAIVKEVDISSKLKPFVDEYINKNKGLNKGTCIVKYYGVEDLMTPPDIDGENEVAFKVYFSCVDGNAETSLGNEIYAYNVKTSTIRDLGSIN